MAFSFGFYLDPALTTPATQRLAFVQADSAPVASDKVIWFGSPDAAVTCQAASAPGVDPVVIAIQDAGSGAGSPSGDVRLALTAPGLDSAMGGAALSLPAILAGGIDHAIAIHLRVIDSTHLAGVNSDISLLTCPLVQS